MSVRLGIFARTFERPSLDEVLSAVRERGLRSAQFNLSSAQLPTLPERLELRTCQGIADSFTRHGVEMVALSGTFNTIHPNRSFRDLCIMRCQNLIRAAPDLGTRVVTLCPGTRNPDDMWRLHPENRSESAWRDLRDTLAQLLPVAHFAGVTLALEPEAGSVVDSAASARRLLDEADAPHLKLILDAANLDTGAEPARQREVLKEAVAKWGADIALVHAKDAPAPGRGRLDFAFLFRALKEQGYEGPVVLHGMAETEVSASVKHVRETLHEAGYLI